MATLKCTFCDKPFTRKGVDIRRGRIKFCSQECYHQSKIIRIDDTLEERWCTRCKKYVSLNLFRPKNTNNYCRNCERDIANNWYRNNREKALLIRRYSHIKRKYGLSKEEYEVVIKNGCAICGAESRLVLDHCHNTGVFRNVLCINCNSGLGMFKDDISLLQQAIEYLTV